MISIHSSSMGYVLVLLCLFSEIVQQCNGLGIGMTLKPICVWRKPRTEGVKELTRLSVVSAVPRPGAATTNSYPTLHMPAGADATMLRSDCRPTKWEVLQPCLSSSLISDVIFEKK
jgi:hypothetical protein